MPPQWASRVSVLSQVQRTEAEERSYRGARMSFAPALLGGAAQAQLCSDERVAAILMQVEGDSLPAFTIQSITTSGKRVLATQSPQDLQISI